MKGHASPDDVARGDSSSTSPARTDGRTEMQGEKKPRGKEKEKEKEKKKKKMCARRGHSD